MLHRKIGQGVLIGTPENPIGRVYVSSIDSRGSVHLAFDFPKEINIARDELLTAKEESP
tara:strand:+ start:1312 stop:1488 length:177 start_codon:yes stop_codon:yes gene_type:complete